MVLVFSAANYYKVGHQYHGHTKQWCIRPGGGMVGKIIEESKATSKAVQGGGKTATGGGTKAPTGSSGNTKISIVVKGLDEQAYLVSTTHLQKIQIETAKNVITEFAGVASTTPNNLTDFFKYQGFMAMEDDVNHFGNKLRISIG
ncbi:hypothetical protein C0989_004168 [Termitomyces sp. Mn162]|nr:hypothetical protein C0989_004168 [Termitomyces sp. Mn162]